MRTSKKAWLAAIAIAFMAAASSAQGSTETKCDPKDPKCTPGGGGGGNGGPPPEVCGQLVILVKEGKMPADVWMQICGKKPAPGPEK